jgi:hypothetical protein
MEAFLADLLTWVIAAAVVGGLAIVVVAGLDSWRNRR